MDVRTGDCVMVNLAAFIGGKARSRQAIPCEVLAVEEGRVQVVPEHPYREVCLWIDAAWVQEKVNRDELLAAR